ncbi:MAG: adenylyl-sulfate kinase [Candidatus Nanopelagicales bacterium]|jgi:bifunctional enzyme CysN/CysC|nr:adenylyl-sulfate kinase [Actinomycetota bacterium]MBT5183123.1 adenylyl-sulfate kinase [Actinomycetota bacterium]MBT5500593.1 adenylyl-sulfate kinase [Actinomycetota bacterium]MBT5806448.1 adenylyl-sulfate kinase [Actinomycetota bacterium]MDA9350216.1 adenylyl-sulfate kinase [Actinomycetota bacterium]
MSGYTPVLHLVTCGSVDDGKSTLIGRLLVETDSVPIDQLEYARTTRRGGSTVPVGEVDYSLLTDGLEAEREQGITIDVAYRHLNLANGRRVLIADSPGHEQYTRNMAVAASNGDVAVLLVDAARGVRPQTHRHLTVCALMGVQTIIVAVNKMDLVNFSHEVFEEVMSEVRTTAARLGVEQIYGIPVSAVTGANITTKSDDMPWFKGESLLGALAVWEPVGRVANEGFRFPVQFIIRAEGNFRGYAGTVVAGSVRPGDEVMVTDSGNSARVDRIVTSDGDLQEAKYGQAVTLTLDHEVDITRGDILASGTSLQPADRFGVDLVWLGEEPLAHGRSYLLISGSRSVPATVTSVRHRLDVVSGHEHAARVLNMNDIGRVEIATDRPIPMDPYVQCRDTGGFLLVDRVSADTVAAGLSRHAMRRAFNLVPHDYEVDHQARSALMGHPARVVWLTGLSGSGKSTIADAAVRKLHAMGIHTYVLDGDNVRTGLNKDLGFTPEDRAENVRRVAEVSKLMRDSGVVVFVALVSPYRSDRETAASLFVESEFVEVFVDTPVDICSERDPKGLYAKAAAGNLPNMTGVGQIYEPPVSPDLILRGTGDLEASANLLVAAILEA